MTKVELIAKAKEMNITVKASMKKAEIEELIMNASCPFENADLADIQAQIQADSFFNPQDNDSSDEPTDEEVMQAEAYFAQLRADEELVEVAPIAQIVDVKLSDFVIRSAEQDARTEATIAKLNGFYKFAVTGHQGKYLRLLECNFKVKVNYANINTELDACHKITEIHQAIRSGKVERRTQAESKARYSDMMKRNAQRASQAQREVAATSVDRTNIQVNALAQSVQNAPMAQAEAKADKTGNPVFSFIKRILGVR